MKIVRWLIYLLLAAGLLQPLAAGAQTEATRLASVRVDLWPDLDQPAVLVLITAELPESASLPALVRLRLPAAVGEPSAVARMTADGSMFNTGYELIAGTADGVNDLLVETAERAVRVEYYDAYQRRGEAVDLAYTWLGGTPVDDLAIVFREPVGASAVTVDAGFEDIGLGSDGGRYYQWSLGPVGGDETHTASLSYQAPAASSVSAQSTTMSPDSEPTPAWAIALAAAGGLALGGGIGWALGRRRPLVRRIQRPPKATPAGFCRQCGNRLQAGDGFCRQCGAKVS